jgi:hypothetical protein
MSQKHERRISNGNMTRPFFLSVLLAALAVSVSAQTQSTPPPSQAKPAEPDYPIIRVGMLSYLQYAAETENRDDANSFDVTRAYLNINAQVASRVRFRFTPDIRRITDGSLAGSLTLRVKYAFGQLDTLGQSGSWARFGLHQTPWLDFEESINRYRVQGTMFAEREALIPGSGDFGASYFTPLPHGYGEVHGGVFNGEGFTQAEANKYKSVQGRLTVRPFPNRGIAHGLRISGFFNKGWYAADRPRDLGIVMGSFEHRHLVATVQYLNATEAPSATTPVQIDRNGWSAFIEPKQGPSGWAGLVRYDSFEPDESIPDSTQQRVIAGGGYWFVWPRSKVGLVVTNEHVNYHLPTRLDENRILLQMHFEF